MNGPTGVLLGSRILDTPLKRDKHVLVDVCTKTGSTERIVVTKGKMKEESRKYGLFEKVNGEELFRISCRLVSVYWLS